MEITPKNNDSKEPKLGDFSCLGPCPDCIKCSDEDLVPLFTEIYNQGITPIPLFALYQDLVLQAKVPIQHQDRIL